MNEWLCRVFIRGAHHTEDPSVREKHGVFASIVGIFVNVCLSVLKLIVGILSSSVAIMADAFNNLSDAGTSAISFVTFRIASKPADRAHPFGHARIEYIASMVVSFLVLLMGFELMTDSVSRMFGGGEGSAVGVSLFTVIVLAASIVMKLWLAFFYRYVGRKIDSSVVRAAATDSLSDCISTSAVLVSSIIVYFTQLYILDAIIGLAVSLLIMWAGVRILNETKNSLLGEGPVEQTVQDIREIVFRYPEALGIHDLLVHNYGPRHSVASLHVEVDGSADIFMLHDAIDNIERAIGTELGILCTVHMDPIETHDETVNELRAFVLQCVGTIDDTLSVHDFRTVVGTTHTNLIFDLVVPFEYEGDLDELVERIKQQVLTERPCHFCVITVDRG